MGVLPQFTHLHQDSSTIYISALVSAVSTDGRDKSLAEKNEFQITHEQKPTDIPRRLFVKKRVEKQFIFLDLYYPFTNPLGFR